MNLVGSIPSSFSKLTNLTHLHMSYVTLSSFPSEIGLLTKLKILYLYSSNMKGTIPTSISKLTLLRYVAWNSNYFSGSIPTGLSRLTNLQVLELSYNRNLSISFSLVSSLHKLKILDLSYMKVNEFLPSFFSSTNFKYLKYIGLTSTGLKGNLVSSIGTLSTLLYLGLNQNSISGSIPNSYGQLLNLGCLQLETNSIVGMIPAELGKLTKLTILDLSRNSLSNSIPTSFSALINMEMYSMSQNQLSGVVPSLNGYSNLRVLNLYSNSLQGPVENLISSVVVYSKLEDIDISNNYFSGALPLSFFKIPTLKTFGAVKNCISGELSPLICSATKLTALALDGLGTASECRKQLYGSRQLSAYGLAFHLTGKLPRCLFEMPKLKILHLSGNGIESTIPESLMISTALTDLSLSYNFINGTIPESMQQKKWAVLDLAYNRLIGSLSKQFTYASNDTSISLSVNRLGGYVPPSLSRAEHVDILEGNLFQCKRSRSDLPENDRFYDNFKCSSEEFENSTYVFIIVLSITIVLLVALIRDVSFSWRKDTRDRDQKSAVVQVLHCCRKVHVEFKEWTKTYKSFGSKEERGDRAQKRNRELYPVVFESRELFRWGNLMRVIRLGAIFVTFIIVSLFLPTYAIMFKEGIHTSSVIPTVWAISAASFSGWTPALILTVIFVTFLAAVFYFSEHYLYNKYKIRHEKKLDRTYKLHYAFFGIPLEFSIQHALLLLVLVAINFMVMLIANGMFIYGTLTQPPNVANFLQYILATFETLWTLFLQYSLFGVNYILKRGEQHERKYCSDDSITRPYSKESTYIDSIALLSMVITNSLVVPLISTAAVSPKCFFNAIFQNANVETSYSVTECAYYLLISGGKFNCLSFFEDLHKFAYPPPFVYNYSCGSTLIESYVAVIVLSMIQSTVTLPLIEILIRIYTKNKNSLSYRLFNMVFFIFYDETGINEDVLFSFKNQFLADIMVKLTLLLTFGVVFPPLAFIICIAILLQLYYQRLNLGRVVEETMSVKSNTLTCLMCKESSLMPDEFWKKTAKENENIYWYNIDNKQTEDNANNAEKSNSKSKVMSALADVLKQSLAEDKRRQTLTATTEAMEPSVEAESLQNSAWLDFCAPPPALCGAMQTLGTKPDCGCSCATCPRVTMQSLIVEHAIGSKVTSFVKLCIEYSGMKQESDLFDIQSGIELFMKGDEIRQLKENNWDLQPGLQRLFDLVLNGEKYILFDAGAVDKYSRGVFGALLAAIKHDERLGEVTFESYYDARLHYDATYHYIKRYIKDHKDQTTNEQLVSFAQRLFCQDFAYNSHLSSPDAPFLAYISCAINMIVHQCTDYQWEQVKKKLLVETKLFSHDIEYLDDALKALRHLVIAEEASIVNVNNYVSAVDLKNLPKNSDQRLVFDSVIEILRSNQEEIIAQQFFDDEKEAVSIQANSNVAIRLDNESGLSLKRILKFQSELRNDIAYIGSRTNAPLNLNSMGKVNDWIEDNSAFPGFVNPCTEKISKDFGYSELIDWKIRNSKSSPEDFLKKFNEQTADISKCLRASVWLLLPSASLFYALILFDILGDEVGTNNALWSPLAMLCVPPFVWLVCRISRLSILFKKAEFHHIKSVESLSSFECLSSLELDETANSAVVKPVCSPPCIQKNIDITLEKSGTQQCYPTDDEGNIRICCLE